MEVQLKPLANRASYPAAYADVCRRFLADYAAQVYAAARDLGLEIPPLSTAQLDYTPLAAQLDTISFAAVGHWRHDDETMVAAVRDALEGLTRTLFGRLGLPDPPVVPAAFWDTPIGSMCAQVYFWLDGDDLITISEAAQLLGLSIPSISNRIDRGQLRTVPDPTARNPQKAGRLVRRSEVLALGKR